MQPEATRLPVLGGGGGVYGGDDGEEHLSFTQGAGHGGSHPHLAHQFVNMLLNGEDAYPNAVQSANITCTGILASHQPFTKFLSSGRLQKSSKPPAQATPPAASGSSLRGQTTRRS